MRLATKLIEIIYSIRKPGHRSCPDAQARTETACVLVGWGGLGVGLARGIFADGKGPVHVHVQDSEEQAPREVGCHYAD